ncbi:MAG: type transport system permease protein [Chloroflexota bacterium]|jgi:ABC-2 type transport system permease protein|nr:type transport system permease protein [Chloroflexota bacterium]
MTAVTAPDPLAEPSRPPARLPSRVPHAGWRVIAAKELGDHLLSVRFIVLLVVLGLAAAIPLYFAADRIRSLAPQVTGVPAIFLALFTVGSQNIGILRVDAFVGMVAPLLGLAFAFDAVNGERSEGTLPRLLAQPIYRDDVINGKFAAGMSVIGLVLITVVTLIAGFGMLRLGIVPHGQEVLRLIAWLAATFLYVALWLAFGLLLSVVVRRAATAALIGFGVWLLVSIFGSLITTILAGLFQPAAGAAPDSILGAAQLREFVTRLMPSTLYQEITKVILDPSVNARDVTIPGSLDQYTQAQQQVSALLSLDKSLLLVWPQIVALVALAVACFVGAYIAFMRQEVRA